MARQGRHICNTLKAIRRQIAEANDIKYEPRECNHEGDCAGTCPVCEAEVRYIEGELRRRSSMGKKVAVAGIAMGMVGLSGCGIGRILQPPLAGIPVMPNEPSPVAIDTLEKETPITVVDSIRPVKNDENVLVGIVEESPQFPGGDKALLEYMKKNLQYPDEVCGQGRVVVSFMVEKDGSISEAKVVKSVCKEFDEEALRLVNAMPKWIPGKQLGEPVSTKYTLPVIFRLE
ncbi:MAG: TonB family protein [Prevotella sp.]|nr:TonB family protein [Prevotella sp.]MBR3067112.1 TonB family protein [Prevotella sp.]